MDLSKAAIEAAVINQAIDFALHNKQFQSLAIRAELSQNEIRITIGTLDKKLEYSIILRPGQQYSLVDVVSQARDHFTKGR